ncbi:uncharacterized protein GGS22DRAFT_97061 [Annulohypoxylon maeteangense]|uniref:uncharacterized protein n=1 Tax=Annulohypoxylon maeteangense TaxID=1927788 RepID=UPI0020075F0E|nr:uncharacterized protein GGS22DRAFT_97061 [Annulohypoxylon maeteangense]KAI0888426.1 hypothetical protein GGS22DRAFT_97061 [Annulohypoxylon maeteangense]
MSVPASNQYCVKEVLLNRLEDPHLTDIASWISSNTGFNPHDQIRRSLLPGSMPYTPFIPGQTTEFDIESVKQVIMKEKEDRRVHLLVVTERDNSNVYGFAWLSIWNNRLLGEPANEEFMDPSRDHNDYINTILRHETPYATHRRQGYYIETAKALRNRRFGQYPGNVIQLRDVILSAKQPNADVLRLLIKSSIEVAHTLRAPLITTLPRLYLEINHELDKQGVRVVDTEKYPFLSLTSHGMRLAETRFPHEDLKELAMFLRQVPVDVMLRVYDKGASPEAKVQLAQLGL